MQCYTGTETHSMFFSCLDKEAQEYQVGQILTIYGRAVYDTSAKQTVAVVEVRFRL